MTRLVQRHNPTQRRRAWLEGFHFAPQRVHPQRVPQKPGHPQPGGAWSRQRGTALVTVMLLITVMSALAVAVTADLRFAVMRSHNVRMTDQAVWFALGAEQLAGPLLETLRETDPNLTVLANGFEQTFPIDGGYMLLRVRDGANCFNLNTLVPQGEDHGFDDGNRPEGRPGGAGGIGDGPNDDGFGGDGFGEDESGGGGQPPPPDGSPPDDSQGDPPPPPPDPADMLVLLLTDIGVGRSDAVRITAGVTDWIDADGTPTSGGAESFDYALASPAYRTPDRPMMAVSELRAVEGVDQTLYLGVLPYVCARPGHVRAPVNVNTLATHQAVLLHAALDGAISVEQATSVLSARPETGFDSVEDVWATPVMADLDQSAFPNSFATTSSVFDVAILVQLDRAYVELHTTVRVGASGRAEVVQRRFGA